MKKQIIFILGVLISQGFCFAQTTSPEIISSSGEHYTGTNAQLSWTIGETMTKTYSGGSSQLTQGFHQPSLSATSIEDLDESIIFNVYPNPTSQILNIEIKNSTENYTISILDMGGKIVWSNSISGNETIDVSGYSDGIYMLTLYNQESKSIKTFKIQKTK